MVLKIIVMFIMYLIVVISRKQEQQLWFTYL